MNSTLRTSALVVLATLVLSACQKTEDAPAPAPAPAFQSAAASVPTDAATIRIIDTSGTTLIAFKPRELELVLGTGSNARTLQATAGDGDKRKYARLGEGVVAEVKAGDDGFKLRGADSRLLWKLKLKDDGIKVSDNEENARPITLKIKDNRIAVADNGKTLGEVSFDGDKGRAQVTDASGKTLWTVQAKKISAAFGLHLATRIPETERAVLELELLARDL